MVSFRLGSEFFNEEEIPLSLADVKYGFDRGWLSGEAVVSWAISQLQAHTENALVFALASADPADAKLLEELLGQAHPDHNTDLSYRKWLYLLLKAAFLSRNNLADPLGVVEQIYTDFEYPPAVEGFVRYMPVEPGGEAGEKALVMRWAEFLRAEHSALCSDAALKDSD